MDQKILVYTDQDTKQDFYKTISSGNDILNKHQYEPIQPNLKTEYNKISDPAKDLVQKIGDSSRVKIEQENCFLYDNSNMINQTFYAELNKKVQT